MQNKLNPQFFKLNKCIIISLETLRRTCIGLQLSILNLAEALRKEFSTPKKHGKSLEIKPLVSPVELKMNFTQF